MTSRRAIESPWDGFWQVLFDDPQDQIVDHDLVDTTVSLRRSGYSVYAGGQFLEIRADSGRPPPSSPLTDADRICYFRTAKAAAGPCTWHNTNGAWTGEHTTSTCPDPRTRGTRREYTGTLHDTHAEVTLIQPDGTPVTELWRKLSGPGTSPLAGAWQAAGPDDRWLFLVTAGHYGVVREDIARPTILHTGDLTDDEILSICNGFGANAGAIVSTKTSFDNFPFVAANMGAYEARKHPTFSLASIEPDRLMIGFRDDGSDAGPWTRATPGSHGDRRDDPSQSTTPPR